MCLGLVEADEVGGGKAEGRAWAQRSRVFCLRTILAFILKKCGIVGSFHE